MTQTPSLEEVIDSGIAERLRVFYTALPGEIVSYDEDTQKASVKITVTNAIEDSAGDKFWHIPVLQNIPVQFPGGGGYRITYPIKKGDKVIYLVSTLPLTEWMNKGSSELDVDPIALNNLSSGWIVPGIHIAPPTDAPTDAVVIHADTVKVGGSDASELVALKKDLENLRMAIQTATITLGPGGATSIITIADQLAQGLSVPSLIPDLGAWPEGSLNLKVR